MKQEIISTGLLVADLVHRHPRRIAAAIAALLLGGASGAFAVASLAPVAPAEPLRLTSDALALAPVQQQIDLLDAHQLTLYRDTRVIAADTAPRLLQRVGVADPLAAQFLRQDKRAAQALFSAAATGRAVRVQADGDQNLQRLTAVWLDGKDEQRFGRLVVTRSGDHFATRIESGALTPSQRLVNGVVGQGVLTVTGSTEMPAGLQQQLATIFAPTSQARTGLSKGDHFAAVYEVWEVDGDVLRTGRVLSAERTRGKVKQSAVWFADASGEGHYYTPAGARMHPTELKVPLAGSLRVTSGFGLRVHPVYGGHRGHDGIDLAAPSGTPVRAAADGRVQFAGVQRGYGNVVYLQHSRGNETTIYGHLSRIDVRVGQAIARGDQLGAVGSTGIATGPHLHFEIRVNGVPQNPATALAEARKNNGVMLPKDRLEFVDLADTMAAELATAMQLVPADFD